jgi:hypothetical protein
LLVLNMLRCTQQHVFARPSVVSWVPRLGGPTAGLLGAPSCTSLIATAVDTDVRSLRGVYLTPSGRFQAVVCIGGKKLYLGSFGTSAEAAMARDGALRSSGLAPSDIVCLQFPTREEQRSLAVAWPVEARTCDGSKHGSNMEKAARAKIMIQ